MTSERCNHQWKPDRILSNKDLGLELRWYCSRCGKKLDAYYKAPKRTHVKEEGNSRHPS